MNPQKLEKTMKRPACMRIYHKNRVVWHLLTGLLLAGALYSCRIIHPYRTPDVGTAGLYRDVTAQDTQTLASLHWNELFTDTLLQKLVAEGIAQNLNLRIAYTRIEQARAYYQQSRLAFFPSLNLNASATEQRLPQVQTREFALPGRQYQLGLSASWLIDVWGRLRSAKRSNLALLLQNEAYARAVQSNLVADIANYYFSLLALDQQLLITEQTVEARRATVAVMRELKEGAIVTEAAVVQSEANQYAAEVTLPDIRRNIRETEHILSILLGRVPGPVTRSTLESQRVEAPLQTGLPSQLLGNRPDVQQAEFSFRSYFELTNVARTYFYPSLTITASGGLSNVVLSNFFNTGSLIGSVTGSLAQPLFAQGANRARLRAAQAQQQEAYLNFQNTLLRAGQEVSNALFAHQTALEKMRVREYQLVALQRSLDYSQELVRYGFANYSEVLIAQQNLLSAQLGGVNDRLQQLQAVVDLYNALGGGWR